MWCAGRQFPVSHYSAPMWRFGCAGVTSSPTSTRRKCCCFSPQLFPLAVFPRKNPASSVLIDSFNFHFAAPMMPLCVCRYSSTTRAHIPLLVLRAVVQVTCCCHRSMLLLRCAPTAVLIIAALHCCCYALRLPCSASPRLFLKNDCLSA